MPMISSFVTYSVDFLVSLASWLVTPVPLAFVGLGLMLFAVRTFKNFFSWGDAYD